MVCIVSNIVSMALGMEGASADYQEALSNVNLSFSIIFMAEAVIKLIAYGPKGYFRSGWNQFDFFVVMASLLDIVLDFSGNNFL